MLAVIAVKRQFMQSQFEGSPPRKCTGGGPGITSERLDAAGKEAFEFETFLVEKLFKNQKYLFSFSFPSLSLARTGEVQLTVQVQD